MTVVTTEITIEPKHPSRFEKNRNIRGNRLAGHPLFGPELAIPPAFLRLSPCPRSPACAEPQGGFHLLTHSQPLDPLLDLGHWPAGGKHPVDLLPRLVHGVHSPRRSVDSPAEDVPPGRSCETRSEGPWHPAGANT